MHDRKGISDDGSGEGKIDKIKHPSIDFLLTNSSTSQQKDSKRSKKNKKKKKNFQLSLIKRDLKLKKGSTLRRESTSLERSSNKMKRSLDNKSSIVEKTATNENIAIKILNRSTTINLSYSQFNSPEEENQQQSREPFLRAQASKTSILEDLIYSSGEEEEEDFTLIKGYFSDTVLCQRSSNIIEDEESQIGVKDFIFIKQIGQGAFGKVFLVKRRNTDDYYAMKVINFLDNVSLFAKRTLFIYILVIS